MILDDTSEGRELVEWALTVWRDDKRTHAERQHAHAWLSDRALGRPMASAELTLHAGDGVRPDDGARVVGLLSESALAEIVTAHEQLEREAEPS